MSARRRGLPPTKLKRFGHRSHVGGAGRRLLSGPRKSGIQDALHRDAKAIWRRLVGGKREPDAYERLSPALRLLVRA